MNWSKIAVLALALVLAFAGVVTAQGTPATGTAPAAPQITWLTVEQASKAPLDGFVYLRGKIISVLEPRPDSNQPYSIYVGDATGQVRVVIFQDVWKQLPSRDFLVSGSSVDIYGESGEFKNVRQIAILKPNHIRLTPGTEIGGRYGVNPAESTEFPKVSVGMLNMMAVGRKVTVRGIAKEVVPPPRERSPFKIILSDATGEIEVVYWEAVTNAIPAAHTPAQGVEMEIRGVVNEYRTILQLRVDDPTWVRRASSEAFGSTPPAGGTGAGK